MKLVVEDRGYYQPIGDLSEAYRMLRDMGLTDKDVVEGERRYKKAMDERAKKLRLAKEEHEKAQAEKNRPISRFLSAIRHHRNLPELLWKLEATLSLEDLKGIKRELPTQGMPKDLLEYANDWITSRISLKK